MDQWTGQQIKEALLNIVSEFAPQGPGICQQDNIVAEAASRLGIDRDDTESTQALLTFWHDLFRQGIVSWGYNLDNPGPPTCHLTDHGRKVLEGISHDPANSDGYAAYLRSHAVLSDVQLSYLTEAVGTFNAGFLKASAVMVGCAAESLSLALRDLMVTRLTANGSAVPANLNDWKIRTVLRGIQAELDVRKKHMPRDLKETFEAYWTAFAEQIRRVRNDAGHPSCVDPVTEADVHASLLIFAELAVLMNGLTNWVAASYP